MRISYVETECRDKISPNCTKVFMRKIQRGRPQVNCEACKNVNAPTKVKTVKATIKAAETLSGEMVDRECPCGNTFQVKAAGRGRRAEKCETCRAAGTVYRANEEGELEAIRAETLAEEQRELREQAGRERAEALFLRMQPLLKRTDRQVIHH